MITMLVVGCAVLGGVAIVLAIVDRALESKWREVATLRRDRKAGRNR